MLKSDFVTFLFGKILDGSISQNLHFASVARTVARLALT